jgi:hypothetical protein
MAAQHDQIDGILFFGAFHSLTALHIGFVLLTLFIHFDKMG